mmetsp:Transcript_94293/g.177423  ORF Transcript_94293/g.177423 Transcript_94293/m.177423 type:complete len:481 (-) Transcript_94293:83-1525(-)
MALSCGRRLPATCPNQRQEGALFALLTLSAINLLNFADRFILSSVKAPIQKELELTDTQTSLPVTGMVLVYMVCAPIFGVLVDRRFVDRRVLLSCAIAFWSAATAAAGFAENFTQLVVFRSLIGVGEAAFSSIVPPMLSDFYPARDRNVVFTVFGLASPLGGALGFGAGALLGSAFGWRKAFLFCGSPGILVAFLIMFLNDPPRGINDDAESDMKKKPQQTSLFNDVCSILSNPAYMIVCLGQCAQSFALGAFSDWYGTLLVRYTGTSLAVAGLVLSAATVVGGIGGSLMGAKAAQFYEPRWKNAYFLVPALFTIPGAVLAFGAVNLLFNSNVAFACIVTAELFFFTYGPPMQTISITVMPVHLRSRSSGIQIFLIHILGDIISPPIVGFVSDQTGSLQLAMQISWMAILVAGLIWFVGYQFLPPLHISNGGNAGKSKDIDDMGLRSTTATATWSTVTSVDATWKPSDRLNNLREALLPI